MSNYNIKFLPAIHYLDKENLPTKNGIYLVFVKKYNGTSDDLLYVPLYLGKVCRDDKGGGIKQRIHEHLNDIEDKIYKKINDFKFLPKDSNGIITAPGTKENVGLSPAVYITTYTLLYDKDIEKVEAALIFKNSKQLVLNEKNTESYNGEDITINIQGATYGLKNQISLKKGDKS